MNKLETMKSRLIRFITRKWRPYQSFQRKLLHIGVFLFVIGTIWFTLSSFIPNNNININNNKSHILSKSTSKFNKFGDFDSKSHSTLQQLVSLKEELDSMRVASDISPFRSIVERQNIWQNGKFDNKWKKSMSKNELNLIKDWHSVEKSKQCSYLIANIYEQIPDWNNDDMFNYYEDDEISSSVFELIVERLRIYDYCFLHGGEDIIKVFNDDILISRKISVEDYNSRMFPFFRTPENMKREVQTKNNDNKETTIEEEEKILWPTVYNMDPVKDKKDLILPLPHYLHGVDIHEFNSNFWNHWIDASVGKGIVVTMQHNDLLLFRKLAYVLQKHRNILPIQVVTSGTEMSENFMDALLDISRRTGQQIKLVDCTPILTKRFRNDKIYGFLNKFIAALFNTFEEAIFIDVDVVPFVPPSEFFNIKGYNETGLYLYRDRRLANMLPDTCRKVMRGLEPSIQEKDLLGTNIKFDKKWSNRHVGKDIRHLDSPEAVIYKNYMHYQEFHVVDSGLIVFNKKKHYSSLIMSTFFGFDQIASGCSWGDKELFWLGSLYSGDDFAVSPKEGSIIGEIQNDPVNKNKYAICSAQLGHLDENDTLMWANGGLKTCKFDNEAAADFAAHPEYFKERYQTAEKLQKLQDEPIVINGVIVPDVWYSKWLKIDECRGYTYCYSIETQGERDIADAGYIIKYSGEQYQLYNDISKLWNTS